MRTPFAWLFSALAAFALTSACGGDDDDGAPTPLTPSPSPAATSLTYHRDVRPIVEANCVGCHSPEGGAFSMLYDPAEWQGGAPSWVGSAAAAVASGTMPPWMPDEACRPL